MPEELSFLQPPDLSRLHSARSLLQEWVLAIVSDSASRGKLEHAWALVSQAVVDQHSVGSRLYSSIHAHSWPVLISDTNSRAKPRLASNNAHCRVCLVYLARHGGMASVAGTLSRTPQCELEEFDFSTFTGSIDEAVQITNKSVALAIRLQVSHETTAVPPVNPFATPQ